MTKYQITLIVLGFILLALMATNPTLDDHKEGIVKAIYKETKALPEYEQKDFEKKLKESADENISRDNYLLFSITKNNKRDKIIGFGLFGQIFRLKQPEIKQVYPHDRNDIIGTAIIIGNLSIAENDFPNVMDFEDAKIVCSNLGDGWRLPTKSELNILFQNQKIIGGFTTNSYWSSSTNYFIYVWSQWFYNGDQTNGEKNKRYRARAVKSI
jgi:hypothetical protein